MNTDQQIQMGHKAGSGTGAVRTFARANSWRIYRQLRVTSQTLYNAVRNELSLLPTQNIVTTLAQQSRGNIIWKENFKYQKESQSVQFRQRTEK